MAEEQTAASPEPVEEPKKPKKKIGLWLGLFFASYVLVGAGNYFYLKSTYVPPPPPPPVEEKEKPVTSIDLGEGEETAPAETLAAVQPAPAQVAAMDTVKKVDTTSTPVAPTVEAVAAVMDTAPPTEEPPPAETKAAPPLQVAKLDSAALKKSIKLAKIVENMPAEDAAKMLEPLSNDMVIDILLRLKQRQAAKIMAAIPSERAAEISREIMAPVVQNE